MNELRQRGASKATAPNFKLPASTGKCVCRTRCLCATLALVGQGPLKIKYRRNRCVGDLLTSLASFSNFSMARLSIPPHL